MNYSKSVLSMCLIAHILQNHPSYAMQKYKPVAIAAGVAAVGTAAYAAAQKIYFNHLHWDWKKNDPKNIYIHQATTKGLDLSEWTRKEPFNTISIADFFKLRAQYLQKLSPNQNEWLWGAATSAHQVEGDCTNNNWYLFEGKQLDGNIVQPAAQGCDTWKHEDTDIQKMKELGINTYRFSVEWSKVFPQQGIVDQEVLNHYKEFCQKLVKNGIKPVITLYHYTEPIWFYEQGGFEKAENIKHFVEFCTTVFNAMHKDVYAWFTFNAPEGIALQGWLTGSKPPAKKNMKLAVEVLHNILEAHVQIYQAFKQLPGGQESRIGILKNIMQLDPWNIANPLDHLACYMGNKLQNESVYNFLTTGEYSVYVPTKVNYHATNEYLKNGGKCLDFIGLNYYCHNYMKNFKPIREPNQEIEIHTNNSKYTIYAEGLYRAIAELSARIAKPLGIPIYVTENGIGTDNDEHRTLHNQRYVYALARAIQDGYDVRGYIHWSLMDNYEWGQYAKHYGLYAVDRNTPELTRSLKPGAQYYKDVVTNSVSKAKL